MKWPTPGAAHTQLAAMTREMSLVKLAPLGFAVFALFGMLGPAIDIASGGHLPMSLLLRYTVLSGLVAVGYALGIMRQNWGLVAAAAMVQIVWLVFFRGEAPGGATGTARLAMDAAGVLILMTVSYTSFLTFNNVTAASYLRVRAEIDLAHEIHQVLVPAIESRLGGFEFFGLSRPSGEVGGDLVDVVDRSADADGAWFGYIADVSGHGVSSGLVMGMFKSALRMRLRQRGTLAELLGDLNTVLYPLKSGSMFITLACARFCGGDTLEYAVAGHLPIIRVRGGAVDEITTPQIPIAMFDTYAFTAAVVEVQKGDLLALITDGLVEVFNGKDEDFGLGRAKSLLAASAERPLRDIADTLVSAARAHGKQLDDQTLLLIRKS